MHCSKLADAAFLYFLSVWVCFLCVCLIVSTCKERWRAGKKRIFAKSRVTGGGGVHFGNETLSFSCVVERHTQGVIVENHY